MSGITNIIIIFDCDHVVSYEVISLSEMVTSFRFKALHMRATLARCIEVPDIDIIRELTLTAARALISQSRPGWRPNKECRHFPSISSL